MNKVILSGRLARNSELRYTAENTAVLRNTIAVNRQNKQDSSADFIPFIAFGKIAELIDQYSAKGKKIMIFGKIQIGSYENAEGKKMYTTEIIVEEVEFLEFKDREGNISQPNTIQTVENTQRREDGYVPIDIFKDAPF